MKTSRTPTVTFCPGRKRLDVNKRAGMNADKSIYFCDCCTRTRLCVSVWCLRPVYSYLRVFVTHILARESSIEGDGGFSPLHFFKRFKNRKVTRLHNDVSCNDHYLNNTTRSAIESNGPWRDGERNNKNCNWLYVGASRDAVSFSVPPVGFLSTLRKQKTTPRKVKLRAVPRRFPTLGN